jgi:two-component system heavy metal sensor histidine kinase CusS
MTAEWLSRSLAVRVTLLCGLIAVGITGMLGANYFFAVRTAVLTHADEQLIGRAEHFRRLVGDARTVRELRDQSMLLVAVLGTAGDVLVVRHPGEALPWVDVNPDRLSLPGCAPAVAFERPIDRRDVCDARTRGLPPGRWITALARSGHDGAMVEITTGHPLASEAQMIGRARDQVLFSTFLAVLASLLLVYLVLRRGLRPLHRVAAQAALIAPFNLAVRLEEHDAPLELQRMVAAFNAMLDRIATGYERLSQSSADLAHEIRTPIGALIGQTQVALSRTRSADEYQQVLESNLEELNRLSLTVDNILFLAQADHATLKIERTTLEMADELLRIAEYFEGLADEAGLRFDVQASGTAWVNAPLCRRALHNLVVNAVRYSTRGTVVRLSGRHDGVASTLVVENEGAPIPPEQLERLFDRFYRADAVHARPAESSGLGLAIVKAIMDLHAGEVTVSSSATGTIRFALRFPSQGV